MKPPQLLVKKITWLILSLLLLFTLAACSAVSTEATPTIPIVQRTKPPFEIPKYDQTAIVQQTETAISRMDEILTYTYIETFDQNTYEWRETVGENRFWDGNITIENGVYTWQMTTINSPFVAWADFNAETDLQDFSVSLRARRESGPPEAQCYGLLFRKSPDGFESGSYVLSVCDIGNFRVMYYDGELGYELIHGWTVLDLYHREDWNLIEVTARGDDFVVSINHQQVLSFTDSRLSSGLVAILIDINGEQPGQIAFDLFGLDILLEE